MAAALVAHAIAQSGDGNSATTAGINTTGANLIVLMISNFSVSGMTISDSKTNSWTALTLAAGSATNVQFYYCYSPTVGSGHTFTVSGTGIFPAIAVQAWSGMQTSSGFDTENTNTDIAATTIATGSVTPSASTNVLVIGVGTASATGALAVDSGFTISDEIDSAGNGDPLGMGYKNGSLSGSENPTWTLNATANVAAVIASFKVATAGAGGPLVNNGGLVHGSLIRGGRLTA